MDAPTNQHPRFSPGRGALRRHGTVSWALGATFALLWAGCGDETGAPGDADASQDAPVFGTDQGQDNGRADGGDAGADSAREDVEEDAEDDVADDAGGDAEDALQEDAPEDVPGEDAADVADAAEAGQDAAVDAPDIPTAATCESPVVNLMTGGFEISANRWRVPINVSAQDNFPDLPGESGVAGGCYAPPVGCASVKQVEPEEPVIIGTEGEEILHRFLPPAPGNYYATSNVFYNVADPPGFFSSGAFVGDPVVYLLDDDSPTAGVLGCNDDGWPGTPPPLPPTADPHSSIVFNVPTPVPPATIQPIYIAVDSFDAASNGDRYGLEVGAIQVATVAATTCQYPTIATACGRTVAGAALFCIPSGDLQGCFNTGLPAVPALNLVTVAVYSAPDPREGHTSFPPYPAGVVPCRGGSRVEPHPAPAIPLVMLRFTLSGTTTLGLAQARLLHANFGTNAVEFDLPNGPIAPNASNQFSTVVELCLAESEVPFSDHGDGSITVSVVDDLGLRTVRVHPVNGQLLTDNAGGRPSNGVAVGVLDPRD